MYQDSVPGNFNRYAHMVSSAVAAQLAWWLSFFPPDRFLILLSSELRDRATATAVRAPDAVLLFLMS